jgi:sodium-dependent phosphate cotransporter
MPETIQSKWSDHAAVKIIFFILTLFVFLVSLKLFGTSFKSIGAEYANEMLNKAHNPFVGLFIGMLATAVIQSSSSSTSIIVTLVAAGTLTVEGAVPLILGANIGTSVTSSIVAFAHIGKRKEYRKAVATATSHDFFNILLVIILLPLELTFGVLSKSAMAISELLTGKNSEITLFNFMDYSIKPTANFLFENGENILPTWLLPILSLALLIGSITLFSKIFKKIVEQKAASENTTKLLKSPIRGLLWGLGLTTLVQSSSVTTSLMVPVAASGKLRLKQIFPFLMGANIGTTVTALIAALSKNEAAITIALVHVLFNIFGVLLFFPIKPLRNLPIELAKRLGNLSYTYRWAGIAYVIGTFFILPLSLYLITK